MFIYPITGTYPSSWTTHKAKRRSLESSMQYDFKMVYTWQPPEISDKGFQSFLSYYIRGKTWKIPPGSKFGLSYLRKHYIMIPKLERFPGMIPPKPFYARIWMCAYIYVILCDYICHKNHPSRIFDRSVNSRNFSVVRRPLAATVHWPSGGWVFSI